MRRQRVGSIALVALVPHLAAKPVHVPAKRARLVVAGIATLIALVAPCGAERVHAGAGAARVDLVP